METLKFNTGRTYTEFGQRIAARRLESGAVIMLDIDRQIDYLFPASIELTQREVMRAYDNAAVISPSEIGLCYADYYAALNDLRSVAHEIPSI